MRVTVQTVVGMRGWSMRAPAPTRRLPSSSLTERTEAVHSGQRSTSRRTAQTRSAGASTSMLVCCSTTSPQSCAAIGSGVTSAAQWRHTDVTGMPTFS